MCMVTIHNRASNRFAGRAPVTMSCRRVGQDLIIGANDQKTQRAIFQPPKCSEDLTSLFRAGTAMPMRYASAVLSPQGLGCAKTKSDLVVMPSGRQIFMFFCSPHDHRAQNSGYGYTA